MSNVIDNIGAIGSMAGSNSFASDPFAQFFVNNKTSTAINRGSGVNTYTCASKRYVPDFEGRIVEVPVDVPSFPGLRLATKASYSASVGAELNPDINFNTPATWTLTDAGYSIGGGKFNASAAGSGVGYATMSIVAGASYLVTFTVDSISVGGVAPYVGGTVGTTRTVAGTYTQVITAGANSFVGFTTVGGSTTGVFDFLSVKRVTTAWSDFWYNSKWNDAVAIGDSITFDGQYITEINYQIGHPNITNKGVSGNKLADMLARFNADVVALSPDLVFIFGGVNDVNGALTSLASMQSSLTGMVDLAVAANIQPVLATIVPYGTLAGWDLTKQARADEYNAWIAVYAATNGYALIDMFGTLREPGTYNQKAIYSAGSDGLHPNTVGHQAMATAISALIASTRVYTSVIPNAWYTPVTPLLSEPAGTNIFANPLAPATQGITVAAVQYTLSFYGTGSITRSGASTGVLTGTGEANRVSVTFTPTAGTLTLTLAGQIEAPQLETGSVATSPMLSNAATTARATTVNSYPVSGNLSNTEGSAYIEFTPSRASSTPATQGHLIGPSVLYQNTTVISAFDGTAGATTANTVNVNALNKAIVTWKTGGTLRVCLNGGTVASAAYDGALLPTTTFWVGGESATNTWLGKVGAVRVFNTALSDQESIRMTT